MLEQKCLILCSFFDSQMSKFEQQIQKSVKCKTKEEFHSKINQLERESNPNKQTNKQKTNL